MQRFLIWAAPAIFVLLWSTGFIGARLGLPHAEPFTFLFVRFLIVLAILVPVAIYLSNRRPSLVVLMHSAIVGVLLHGAYLGGVFFAIDRGMPAGVSALVVSLQPIITIILAAMFLGEKTSFRTIMLFFLGLCGVAMVLGPNLGQGEMDLPGSTLIASALAVLGISVGTVYQKHFATGTPLLEGLAAQYSGAAVVLGILAWSTETMHITWTGDFLIALGWLVFVLSFGAVGLLMFLIRRDSVARTSALFFLVPGFTAITAAVMFGEVMSTMQIAGLMIAAIAVALVGSGQRAK